MDSLITTYGEAKDIIRKDLESMSKKFITIGYYLKYIRDKELYIQDGFESIWDFARDTYGISKSTCSRWMHMNDKFSEGGNSPKLRQEFASFGKSQLQEMLYLDDKQIEQAKPEMTAKEIREIRKPQNRTPDPEENLEGQMSIENYPEILPEEVPCFRKGGEPYGYTWYGVVKEYLKTAYTEDSAKIKFMGNEYLILRRPERTFFYDAQGNTLFEAENARLEDEYNWIQQTKPVAPPQQKENTGKQQPPVERGCITGKNPYGSCVCCGKEGTVSCCAQCKESCNGRCGWIEQEPVASPRQNEEIEVQQDLVEDTHWECTPKEVLEEKREELNRWIEAFAGENEPEAIKKQRIIVNALEYMVQNLQKEEDPEQLPLPKLKNNDQRKEWLNNYRSWGTWYKDEHIGATYYQYQFENGAVLIVEEYENENEYTGVYISSYFHLVGGPEPQRKNGIPKWNRNKKYNRYPNSETELIEFLKEIQKG